MCPPWRRSPRRHDLVHLFTTEMRRNDRDEFARGDAITFVALQNEGKCRWLPVTRESAPAASTDSRNLLSSTSRATCGARVGRAECVRLQPMHATSHSRADNRPADRDIRRSVPVPRSARCRLIVASESVGVRAKRSSTWAPRTACCAPGLGPNVFASPTPGGRGDGVMLTMARGALIQTGNRHSRHSRGLRRLPRRRAAHGLLASVAAMVPGVNAERKSLEKAERASS